jgi:hypothetical protein
MKGYARKLDAGVCAKARAHRVGACVIALGVLAATAVIAHAATLHVADNGVDSGACGATARPCRSIKQAVTDATAGTTMKVRSAAYRDLDGRSAVFGVLPGVEAPSPGAMMLSWLLGLFFVYFALSP